MNRRSFIGVGAVGLSAAGLGYAAGQFRSDVPAKLSELPAPPSPETTRKMFPGFTEHDVRTTGATIRALAGGEGPPLLLVHGHPETHVTWHKVAPALAADFTVIVPDLRGYGDSSKPPGGEKSVNYAPRAMAQDLVEVMKHFGFDRFSIAGHDRGGRVAHRLALDHPDQVTRVAVLDIAPTLTMYRDTNQEFATRYVWWFFQIQPPPLPEHMIGLDPDFYMKEHLTVQNKTDPGGLDRGGDGRVSALLLLQGDHPRCLRRLPSGRWRGARTGRGRREGREEGRGPITGPLGGEGRCWADVGRPQNLACRGD
jgi:pimeloyl-ACP methyl ester carboxylesterase